MNENIIKMINESGWHHWYFEEIKVEYSNVTIVVESPNGEVFVHIICKHYIGFDYIGHWDESVIEDIYVEQKGDLIDKSLSKVKQNYGDSPNVIGNERDFKGTWLQVNVKLIDGVVIRAVCQDVETYNEEQS